MGTAIAWGQVAPNVTGAKLCNSSAEEDDAECSDANAGRGMRMCELDTISPKQNSERKGYRCQHDGRVARMGLLNP